MRCLIGLGLLAPMLAMATVPAWLSPRLREHPLAGVIVNAQGEKVPESELLSTLASARFAFIGEKHDNPDHHQIELRLIRHRLAGQPGSAVVFEMLDDAQRPVLASIAADDSLEQIREKLALPAKGWDFAVYGPLFQASAKEGKLVAGNVGKKFIGEVYAKGEPALAAEPRFSTVPSATEQTRSHFLERIYEAHCGKAARDTLGPMVAIQLAKDASMASAMADNAPALLVAGAEHVRADTGVPSHVRVRDAQASRVVIQLVEVTDGETGARAALDASGPADFYWFTPATEVRDDCADVKGRAATGTPSRP
ncbi:MAG: ChaN family lipoprotein [Gammaproteobacteria bacterium]|nr:ChaN family lipoprotein [Gammaproteobacteria bacterium]